MVCEMASQTEQRTGNMIKILLKMQTNLTNRKFCHTIKTNENERGILQNE